MEQLIENPKRFIDDAFSKLAIMEDIDGKQFQFCYAMHEYLHYKHCY